MGSVYKAIAVYPRPFWRDRASGELLVLGTPGGGVFDTSAPGGPGHLCVLVGGAEARELDGLDGASRRAAVLGPLVPHLGSEVLAPASWHEKAWHLDEHAGGGYTALPNPGTTEGFFPVACEPTGDIHWAGSETASEHAGYVEGAIESGERVAREVSARLGAPASAPRGVRRGVTPRPRRGTRRIRRRGRLDCEPPGDAWVAPPGARPQPPTAGSAGASGTSTDAGSRT